MQGRLFLLLLSGLLSFGSAAQQREDRQAGSEDDLDTLVVSKGLMVVLADTSFIADRDTVIITEKGRIKEDPYSKSDKFYDSLEQRADKARVTRELHELLIKKKRAEFRIDSVIIKSEDAFRSYAGMVIRKVQIKKVDLLEGSVLDTTLVTTTRFGKLINKLHKDTRSFIIRNNLLFEAGDRVDPYVLSDNERILRQFKTIRDARIYLNPVPGTDSVDVVVVTQDVASVGATGRYSSLNRFNIDVYDVNILGYAKQLQVSYFRNTMGVPANGYEVSLREPNFGNSFISGELKYTDNYLRNRTSFSLGREFLTPEMRYAGGVEMYRTRENYLTINDTIPSPYKQNSLDAWLGRSFQLATRTNLVLAVRNHEVRFFERPLIAIDSNYFFYERSLFLGGLTLIRSDYFKGSLIRGFGRTEDVPVNTWIGTTFGKESHEFYDRPYIDLRGGVGHYFERFGYINISTSAGGFRAGDRWEDGLISTNAMYFSNLMETRRTKIRQFVNASFVSGYARTIQPFIGVVGRWRGEFDFVPVGSQRTTIGSETVYFTPGYFYGFKFAIYHGFDLHFLRTQHESSSDIFFPSFRAGIRMLNDNLTFPTLSIDLTYYAGVEQYAGSFAVRFSTTLPNLFGTPMTFKPVIAPFQ
jgi:hypothetical protein